MFKNIFIALSIVFVPCLIAENQPIHEGFLKEEFNILPGWFDGMTWGQFIDVRKTLKRDELIKYLDKIEVQKLAKEAGLQVPLTYIASYEKVPFASTISSLPSYVVKPTHLSCSDGLIIVVNGINVLTGELTSAEQVQASIFDSFEQKVRCYEAWALHQVRPGFMVQEYIPDRLEVKIQTIWELS